MVLIIACRYFVDLNIESSKGTKTKSLLLAQCPEQCPAQSGVSVNEQIQGKKPGDVLKCFVRQRVGAAPRRLGCGRCAHSRHLCWMLCTEHTLLV